MPGNDSKADDRVSAGPAGDPDSASLAAARDIVMAMAAEEHDEVTSKPVTVEEEPAASDASAPDTELDEAPRESAVEADESPETADETAEVDESSVEAEEEAGEPEAPADPEDESESPESIEEAGDDGDEQSQQTAEEQGDDAPPPLTGEAAAERIRHIVEAALLAAGKPLSIDRLLTLFLDNEQPDRKEVRDALLKLQEDYDGRGIEVREVSTGWRIQVRKEYASWVSRLWEEKPGRYSRALLETLSLIAYRQPITRGEIEEVRGVAVSTNIVKTLLERDWVRVVGHRDVPGRPSLYATTREFLDYFGLKSLDELPTLAEIKDLDELNPSLDLPEPEAKKETDEPETGQDAEAGEQDVSGEPSAPAAEESGSQTAVESTEISEEPDDVPADIAADDDMDADSDSDSDSDESKAQKPAD